MEEDLQYRKTYLYFSSGIIRIIGLFRLLCPYTITTTNSVRLITHMLIVCFIARGVQRVQIPALIDTCRSNPQQITVDNLRYILTAPGLVS